VPRQKSCLNKSCAWLKQCCSFCKNYGLASHFEERKKKQFPHGNEEFPAAPSSRFLSPADNHRPAGITASVTVFASYSAWSDRKVGFR
jgi:hypothetical protein